MRPKRIAILTGGGDCPGLNAVIRAVAKKALGQGYEVIGIEDGYEGLVKNKFKKLENSDVSGILTLGGTITGTVQCNGGTIGGGYAHTYLTGGQLINTGTLTVSTKVVNGYYFYTGSGSVIGAGWRSPSSATRRAPGRRSTRARAIGA